MSNKSVSLFEVLTPSNKSSLPSQMPKEESSTRKTDPNPILKQDASNRRPEPKIVAKEEPLLKKNEPKETVVQKVSEQKTAEPKTKESKAPVIGAQADRHSVDGFSVRKKDDHFGLIVTCMLLFSALTLIVGYSIGLQRGRQEILAKWPTNVSQVTPVAVVEKKKPEPIAAALPPVEVLPTSMRTISKDLDVSVMNPAAPKSYTLQVQTLGRNQKDAIDDLLGKLKSSGFVAFADASDGAVFVGRLESVRGPEVDQLKNALARFNWRQRNFSSAYVRKIPPRLLEN